MNPLLVQQDREIRWLRLNRPHQRNALDPTLVSALSDAVADAASDPATGVVVISGEGPSFCAGADLGHLHSLAERGDDPLPFLTAIADCFDEIEGSAKPVVAAVHGHAVAGGLELALACDVVIAETGALIGDGHIRHRLLPAGGSSVRLPRKVGEPLARWLILSGELLPAETFAGSGFVHQLVPPNQLSHHASELARILARQAGPSQVVAKRLLTDQLCASRDVALIREREAFRDNWHRTDIAESLSRFAGKSDRIRPEGKKCADMSIESSW